MNFTRTNCRVVFLTNSVLAGISFALPQTAGAQTSSTTHHRMHKNAPAMTDPALHARAEVTRKKMIADLHLTSEQQATIQKLQTDFETKSKSINGNKSLTSEQKKAQMTKLRTKSFAQLNALLTPEQHAKHKAMMQQRRMQQMKAVSMPKGIPPKRTN